MDAAANVAEHSKLYNALFYNFRDLKMAAERYSSSSVGGGYGRAGESIRKTTEHVRESSTYAFSLLVSNISLFPSLDRDECGDTKDFLSMGQWCPPGDSC